MDQKRFTEMWDASWNGESWMAPWDKALDLSPAQAAWSPAPGRHSIWQLVNHVAFWRTVTLDTIAGRPRPTEAKINAEQFAAPKNPSADAWNAARKRLEQTHRDLRAHIGKPTPGAERIADHLVHDAYHLGQIMYLRAMQGLIPLA